MVLRATPWRSIRLSITLASPPEFTGDRFGLQDRDQQLLAGVSSTGGGLRFDCTIEVRSNERGLDYRGRNVHGPLGGRFLYLSLRADNGTWARRTKLDLQGIPPELIMRAGMDDVLSVTIMAADRSRAVLVGDGWSLLGPS